MRGSVLCEPSLPPLLTSTTPVAATMDLNNTVEEDAELVAEDHTTIRKTTGAPTASPRRITPRSATTNPSPTTNATMRTRKMTPVTTAVNPATDPQIARLKEEVRLPASKLNAQKPPVAVQTSPQPAKKPATAQAID
jgi:hypothetical protein